jgi:shikimate kinase
MGSGKSSVAQRLARRLARQMVDLDARIEDAARCTIAELFATQGEAAFRALETQVLREALQRPGVIATGGGVPARAENRALLQEAARNGVLVVYLRATPDTLARRIRRQPGQRPLIDGERILNAEETRARVAQLLNERAPHYEACAGLTVDTDALRLNQIVARILPALRAKANQGKTSWPN